MESHLKETLPSTTTQNQDVNKTESVENFQKFIYDLFDKNGIINDLRAYLRGHIVDILKSAQTGHQPACQKQFTRRLESTFQALNMLVAEYLLCLEFNYTLSVFVSEIPLANMVFGLAKSFMGLGADGEATGLKFGENDVWAILNYIGIKCDSEHATAVVNMYNAQEKSPLLLCILKCAQLCETDLNETASQGSISTSSKISTDKPSVGTKCKHPAFCKACRGRYRRLKDKYRRKKARYTQKAQANTKVLNLETLMKNIGDLERSLVDETFEQWKSVYETELDMFKAQHEGQIKNSLASHVKHFQRMQNELEESYKAREEALKADIVQKKRFLWGLAQALRTQHSQMTQAMQAVKMQTAELSQQEQNLKLQRTEAEESLKKRAEEMRQQIADELIILERHLEAMKTERDTINREKNSESKMNMEVQKYLQNHHQLWKEELNVLKKYIENATFPKRVTERSTITDDVFKGMNNEIERDKAVVREGRPDQVVNDLKKQKNVNFNKGKAESDSRGSRSSPSSEEEILRRSAAQPIPVRPEPLQRPPDSFIERRLGETCCGWRKGAGEERVLLPARGARVLVPGDTLPFVGVLGRTTDSRKHLLSRWRVLRRHAPPPPAAPQHRTRTTPDHVPAENIGIHIQNLLSEPVQNMGEIHQDTSNTTSRDVRSKDATSTQSPKRREKSPRSVLKEAKEKLRTVTRPSASREKSPSAVLREAKLRLRKLEIEAEAVERSYMDFRRRRERPGQDEPSPCIPKTASKLSTHHKEDTLEHSKSQLHATDSLHLDLEKYFKKYQMDLELGQDHFRNKNSTATPKNPVPEDYSEFRKFEPIPKQDYLEKPILEFRKLYYTNSERVHGSQRSRDNQEPPTLRKYKENCVNVKDKSSDMKEEKDNKLKELDIFKDNVTKNHDLQDKSTKETVEMSKEEVNTSNLLLVEVEKFENVSEVKELSNYQQTDIVVVLESSVDSKQLVVSEQDASADRISTTMTVIVSPKQNEINDTIERTATPVERAKTPLAQGEKFSNINTTKQLYASKDYPDNYGQEVRNELDYEIQTAEHNSVFEVVKIDEDYSDDFADDVYSNKSEDSPISLPKTSEDENFWD